MGLDITAYRQVKKLDAVFNEHGEPIDPATRELLEGQQFYVNSDFPGRNGSIEDRAVYSYEGRHGFRAGSYSGYNGWRDELAKLAGYPGLPVDRYNTGNVQIRHDAGAWGATSGPFWELINFSDCEGVIGPELSAKLAKDFAEFDERAQASTAPVFYERFQLWRKAFEMAADNGAVSFH